MRAMLTIFGLLFVSSTYFTSTSFAEEIVKTCSIKMKMPGDNRVIPTTFQIVKSGNVLIAKTIQTVNGNSGELPNESASIAEFSVRAGLTANTPNMNEAENLIQGTEGFLNNPDIGSSFSVGLDIKSVRSAKVYEIGKFTHMGGTVIIEAKDKDGKEMGSFVTGFMPFACE
ncbi:MAG TPA: hypothetical protein VIG33_01570 [Pseudobdellovibrionaceae bacterium]|jgi:hypothetical protein